MNKNTRTRLAALVKARKKNGERTTGYKAKRFPFPKFDTRIMKPSIKRLLNEIHAGCDALQDMEPRCQCVRKFVKAIRREAKGIERKLTTIERKKANECNCCKNAK